MSQASPLMLEQALHHAQELAALLEREFDCLRRSDIDNFEALQATKAQTLGILEKISDSARHEFQDSPEWAGFLSRIHACRDAHQRNELLLRRQLEAVRGTLETLVADANAEPALYDHLGQRSARAIRALHSYA